MQSVSTEHVPASRRLAYVHDFIARNWAGMRFTPLDERDMRIDISVFDLPDAVGVARARYPAMTGGRPRDLLGDGRDNYTLAIVSEDHDVRVEGGNYITVKGGDLLLVNEGTSFEVRHARAAAVEVVSLGRRQIAARVPRLELQPCYHIPRQAPGAGLFAGYANLLRQSPPQGEKARQIAANHIHDLVANVLDGFVPQGGERDRGGIRAARLELARKDIRKLACDPALGIGTIALRQGVSARYIQQLFEREGTTFTQYLRDCRLAMAHRRLQAAPVAGVAAIAFECGFADLSHFNRVFRQRYGLTPSDVRAQALRNSRHQE